MVKSRASVLRSEMRAWRDWDAACHRVKEMEKKEAEATKETAISRYGWTMEAKAYMHFCKAKSLYYSALEFAMALEKNEKKRHQGSQAPQACKNGEGHCRCGEAECAV